MTIKGNNFSFKLDTYCKRLVEGKTVDKDFLKFFKRGVYSKKLDSANKLANIMQKMSQGNTKSYREQLNLLNELLKEISNHDKERASRGGDVNKLGELAKIVQEIKSAFREEFEILQKNSESINKPNKSF